MAFIRLGRTLSKEDFYLRAESISAIDPAVDGSSGSVLTVNGERIAVIQSPEEVKQLVESVNDG
jgi:hypothetical protein